MKYCELCGHPHTSLDTHHLVGGCNRTKCDEDGLTINICRICHAELHRSAVAEKLSKMLGQAIYETNNTRQQFVDRYGKLYFQ